MGDDSEDVARQDFLLTIKAPSGVGAIVTNPPWKSAPAFIDHALDIGMPVFFLLSAQFLYTQANARFWSDCRSIGYVTARPKWIEGSDAAAKDNVAWHEFGADGGDPTSYPCHTGACRRCSAAIPARYRFCSTTCRDISGMLK